MTIFTKKSLIAELETFSFFMQFSLTYTVFSGIIKNRYYIQKG